MRCSPNGTVVAWGESDWGDLGNDSDTGPQDCGTTMSQPCGPTPAAVQGLTGVDAISAGANDTLALLSSGEVMAWGNNGDGELGDGTANGPDVCEVYGATLSGAPIPTSCSTKPVAVAGLGLVTAISTGTDTSYGVGPTGAVAAWGANEFGQLGIGTAAGPDTCGANPGVACSLEPVLVSGIKDATAITAGNSFALALRSNGTVMAWGVNDGGALGDGSTSPATGCGCVDKPVAAKGLSGVTALSPEGDTDFSLALRGAFPTVSGFSPTSAVAGKTLVTITGTNLAGAPAVKFNGVEAAVSSDTATQIKATVPNGATTGRITVTTPEGTATSGSSFTVTFTLNSFTPASGPAGTDVTITGTGFTSSSTVKFNGVAATVLSRTPPASSSRSPRHRDHRPDHRHQHRRTGRHSHQRHQLHQDLANLTAQGPNAETRPVIGGLRHSRAGISVRRRAPGRPGQPPRVPHEASGVRRARWRNHSCGRRGT